MRKDWILIGIIGLILIVGLGLIGYLKLSKKQVIANPEPSASGQAIAGAVTAEYFSEDAKVMYFYSDFCHWCQKEMSDVLPDLGKEGYRLKPMDVATNPNLGNQYNITGTPTFVAANGDRLVGYQEAAALKAFLDQHKE